MVQWLPEEQWPTAIKGQVFALAALDRLGRAMFGSDWTGNEGWAETPPPVFMPLEGFGDSASRLRTKARRLIEDRRAWQARQAGMMIRLPARNRKQQRRREMPQAKFNRLVDRLQRIAAAQSRADWDIHVAHLSAQQDWAGIAAAIARRSAVRRVLTEAAANGEVRTYARPIDGGAPRFAIPVECWDVEGDEAMEERFGGGVAIISDHANRHPRCYLFFDAIELDSLCADHLSREGEMHQPGSEAIAAVAPSNRTGGAGRPTSMHLIRADLEQRAAAGDLLSTLSAEAAELRVRFERNPDLKDLPPPAIGTIENGIRERLRQLRRPSIPQN